MSKNNVYCGIDVAKAHLDAFCLKTYKRFNNDPQGWSQLLAWLDKLSPEAVIVCEASGGYEKPAMNAFQKAQRPTHVVQPLRVRQFAASTGKLAKTDKIDAQIIAHYAEVVDLHQSLLSSPEQDHLEALVDFREQIKLKIVALQNQVEQLVDSKACLSANRLLKAHQKEEKFINAAIDELLSKSASINTKVEKLTAFQGVGKTTAVTVLAHMPELGTLNEGQIASLAGLAPFNRDSGTLKGKRSIRGGRAQVRKALYMAALTAIRVNPILSKFYKHLTSGGKPFKVAIVAVMRKLLIAMNYSLKNPHFSLVS